MMEFIYLVTSLESYNYFIKLFFSFALGLYFILYFDLTLLFNINKKKTLSYGAALIRLVLSTSAKNLGYAIQLADYNNVSTVSRRVIITSFVAEN